MAPKDLAALDTRRLSRLCRVLEGRGAMNNEEFEKTVAYLEFETPIEMEFLAEARRAREREATLETALREIAALPCNLKCDLKDGSHFSDCVAVSDAVDIARRALEAKP